MNKIFASVVMIDALKALVKASLIIDELPKDLESMMSNKEVVMGLAGGIVSIYKARSLSEENERNGQEALATLLTAILGVAFMDGYNYAKGEEVTP